jgi:NADH dehydrogenase FAD-containing subunit
MAGEDSSLLKKKLVIIGNGVAGSQLAANMAKKNKYEVIMVTPFDYHEISVNMTKVVATGPEEHNEALHALVKEDNVTYKIGCCKDLKQKHVVMSTGEIIDFDVCVVCTGEHIESFYPDPVRHTSISDRKAAMEKVYEDIKKAEKIVIGGGGPVGAEAAADIKLRNPMKSVTVVTSAPQVLSKMSSGFPDAAAAALTKMGVEIVVGEKVLSSKQGIVVCESGKILECDYYIEAFSRHANTSFMPAGSTEHRGHIKVDPYFKIEGFRSGFSFGDCSNVSSSKNFPQIEDQLQFVTYNVASYLEGKPLKAYKPGFMGKFAGPAMVALGHSHLNGVGIGPDIPAYGTCVYVWTSVI